jgi:PAS domain S-box-containing protein
MIGGGETPPRILIVEDEQVVAMDLERGLRSLGYEVLKVTETGRSAIRLAEQERPDLILMDIQLKGTVDGITAAGEIAKNWRIPVVFLTANGDEEVVSRARAAGPYGYLIKPFRLQELNATMLVALQQHRRAQQLFSEHSWLYTMLSSIVDGVIAIDAEVRIRYMNPAAERLTGWSWKEAEGKLVREVWAVTTLAGESVLRCRLEDALVEGTAATEQRFLLLNRHGHEVPIEDSATPIVESGRVTGAISVFRDISNALRRERDLEEHRERLEEQVQLTESALGHTRSELRALSGHLLHAQEAERRRLAQDLHDDFGQRTALLGMEADQLEALPPGSIEARELLQRIREHIDVLSEDLRRTSHTLYPSILGHAGLDAGLRTLIDDFRQSGLNVSMRSTAVTQAVSLETATALYRIAQECLRNAVKHCGGASVRIALAGKDDQLHLTIEDSGPGFDLHRARAKGGLGLLSMQERAHGVGGSILLRTAPGKGTQIMVRVPLLSPSATSST